MRRNKHQQKYINKKAAKWIDALESGEYKQCRNELTNGEGFCCLGVACEIDDAVQKQVSVHGIRYLFNGFYQGNSLPSGYDRELGLQGSDSENVLVRLNDHEEKSFKEIAQRLRDKPEDFFTPITEQ